MRSKEAADPSAVVELFLARDESALNELDRLYGKLIYKTAFGILHSAEDAREIANDTLHEVWRRIPPDRPESLAGFTLSICRRMALNRLESLRAAKRGSGRANVALDALGELADVSAGFEEELVDSMVIREALNGFVRSLGERDKAIFLERYFLCYGVEKIASRLGITKNLVYVSLSRMRSKLREELERRTK